MDRHSSEIWATVRRYGAGEFAHMESDTQAATYFIIRDRWIPFLLAMPAPKAAELTKTETGADRSASAVETAREPACRSCWQARALIIEAKFEVVEVGIVVFEDEPWPTPSRRGRASPSARSCPRTCGWPVRRPRLIGPLFEKDSATRVAGAAFKKSTPARATPGGCCAAGVDRQELPSPLTSPC